jgi:hypothetical protein
VPTRRKLDPSASDGLDPPQWTITALGLSVCSELPLQGFSRRQPSPERRHVRLTRVAAEALVADWDGSERTCLLERRLLDGTLGMRVEQGAGDSYRVLAPGHGDFVVSADGSLVRCAPAEGSSWRWQRPLFAQVLPLAASLQGLELLHASAVVLQDTAVAFTGRSGIGKTSLAVHLTGHGASLLTDDVLSLECVDHAVLAHRGVPLANVACAELEAMSPTARARLGRPLGMTDKVHIEPAGMPDNPFPLARLYFVQRNADVDDVVFQWLDHPDPQQLLGATFLAHLTTPRRLMTQLQTCAQIARHVSTFRLLVPEGLSARGLARAVESHIGEAATAA